MPKAIDSYRRTSSQADQPNKPLPKIFIAILLILLLFLYSVWTDSTARLLEKEASLGEKSQLCLVEFTQKKCDSLHPSTECKNLLSCLREKELWQSSKIWEFGKMLAEEVLTDYCFPGILIGLLLLFEVNAGLQTDKTGGIQE